MKRVKTVFAVMLCLFIALSSVTPAYAVSSYVEKNENSQSSQRSIPTNIQKTLVLHNNMTIDISKNSMSEVSSFFSAILKAIISMFTGGNDMTNNDEVNWNVEYVRTSYDVYDPSRETVSIVTNKDDLAKFVPTSVALQTNGSSLRPTNENAESFAKYTDAFFASSYLVIISIAESSGSIRHEVESVDKDGNITIKRIVPEIGTADMAHWYIIIELARGYQPNSFDVAFN